MHLLFPLSPLRAFFFFSPYASPPADSRGGPDPEEIPTSGISRPLADILKELNKKVPDALIKTRIEDGVSIKYVPWHIVNRIMNVHAPEWSGEVKSITYSSDGKSVSVIYRVTLYGTDAESYYNVYGGRGSQYPIYGGGAGTIAGGVAGVYPYFQIGQGTGYGTQGQGYGHFPQLLYYTAMARSGGLTSFGQQQYGASVSVAALPTATTSGVTMALPATAIPSPTSPYRLLPVIPTFTPSTGSAEPSSA